MHLEVLSVLYKEMGEEKEQGLRWRLGSVVVPPRTCWLSALSVVVFWRNAATAAPALRTSHTKPFTLPKS